ncbi:uncharacterized protein MELLADRAFT_57387 [Melampsora larici-populina 98AG31]|uniref:4a-hydroxytetrahydrobiopterin dehydratase n=1 Tax=Melampsora larici-populina (strain 98AG31 / pathotype 3-4-7) TaxID=747676 RepID=F4S1R5_MELLP|nr:uncharacterized protein MELLADRAFT_57387 [Melampsora larici-populina 98AG31]EGG01459.1 hypothetical protein MELLADRAFT_57387 [Melampsora larici-populina 98AG31]
MFRPVTSSFRSLTLSRLSSIPNLPFNPTKRSTQTTSKVQKTKQPFKVYKTRLDIDELLDRPENSSLIRSEWKVIPIEVNGNQSYALKKTFDNQFKTWGKAIEWINDKLRPMADECDHHPDINLNNYNQLHLTLFTHSVGGLTPRDIRLALKIDQLNPSDPTS